MKTSAADLVAQCVIERKSITEVDWKRNLVPRSQMGMDQYLFCLRKIFTLIGQDPMNQGMGQYRSPLLRSSASLAPPIWALSSRPAQQMGD